jgi:radical SAM superfamily enzyme with C-terminal helix-hairpin-helix motif
LYNGEGLKKGISAGKRPGIDNGIIHTDNANPAVIAEYPERSREALRLIKDNITPGSVLAFGLESSDPDVRKINNLNSTPEQVKSAISIMNDVGREYGENGMPWILPGINFLGGLPGQSGDSYRHDIALLKDILKNDLLIRRINIRKVNLPVDNDREDYGDLAFEGFREFREEVRGSLDPAFLSRILPRGHVIKGIYMEAASGHVHFGRQIGSYPILAGVEHRVDIGSWIDIAVTEVSSRSITGFRTPFKMKDASYRDLIAIPGIGKKRAANFFTRMGKGKMTREDIEDLGWVNDHILI